MLRRFLVKTAKIALLSIPILGIISTAHSLANINGNLDSFGNIDGRGLLADKADQLGLDQAAVDSLMETSGIIWCDSNRSASATLIGSNMQILTAVHTFYDDAGKIVSDECYFTTYAAWEGVRLDLSNSVMGPFVPGPSIPTDYAVIALERPFIGVYPFPFSPVAPTEGTWVIAVSGHQVRHDGTAFDERQPVVQQCKTIDNSRKFVPTVGFTDCDVTPGASGGAILVQQGGEWVAAAVVSSSGKPQINGEPYDLRKGSSTKTIGLDGTPIDAIALVASRLPEVDGLIRAVAGNTAPCPLDLALVSGC